MGVDGNTPQAGRGEDAPGAAETLRAILERFSLPSSEAKTLVALVRLGSGTPAQLCPLTGISRPNLYPVLESLAHRGFIHKMPGRNAVWAAPEREELLARLQRDEAQRAKAALADLSTAREALATMPAGFERAAQIFRVSDEATGGVLYLEALGSVQDEILVWNRGPYPGDIGVPDELVAAMARGVKARALWEADEFNGADAMQLLAAFAQCQELGVDQRVVDSLPHVLAILDRAVVLVSVPDDEGGELPYPGHLFVRNKAFATSMAAAFDHFWEAQATSASTSGGGEVAGSIAAELASTAIGRAEKDTATK